MTRDDIIEKYPQVKYDTGKKSIGTYSIPKGSSFIIIGETTPENDMRRIERALNVE